jgi:AcrR family transcriptional regulator
MAHKLKQILNNRRRLLKINMNDDDRRVLRTRRLLKKALLDLISERPFEEITIRDITDHADIGYATFFRHYDGKDELMLELFSEMLKELESIQPRHSERYFEEEGYRLFKHVQENLSMYRGILDSRVFARKFRTHMSEIVQMHIHNHISQVMNKAIPTEIAANHMVSSLLGLIDWWLSNEMPYTIERMAMVYDLLIIRATWQVLASVDASSLPWEDQA